jgi:hypothetical protein
MSKKLMVVFILALSATLSCNRNNTMLPTVSFSISVNINEPSFFDATVPMGWVYYNGPNVNLIIYRVDQDHFNIYDARSTYNPTSPCYVRVNSDNVTVSDQCSTSKWLLNDGSLISGPATYALLDYSYSFDPVTGVLLMYN